LVGFEVGSEGLSAKEIVARTHPGDRTSLQQAVDGLRRGGELAPTELRVTGDDGELRYIEVAAERGDAHDDDPARVVGVVRDVTEERLADLRVKLRLSVSRALANWTTLDESAPALLEAITSGWGSAVATLWVPDGDMLVSRLSWVSEDLGDCRLAEVANTVRLPMGIGLAGWAWQSGKPVDGSRLPADRVDRVHDLAQRAGFKAALAIPALAEGEVVAVIDLHLRDKSRISEQALETMLGIGYEIGGVLSSRRGGLARSPLTAREREILQLAADGLTTAEIASRLVVERSTVKTHFEHIYGKLAVPDRAAAVAQALRHGLID
jgi:DNA-binding CsgD family transcriptional regulator